MSVYQIVKLNFEALVQFQAEVSFHGNRFSLDQLQAHFTNFSGPRWESLYDEMLDTELFPICHSFA